jgi:hypothetical protein
VRQHGLNKVFLHHVEKLSLKDLKALIKPYHSVANLGSPRYQDEETVLAHFYKFLHSVAGMYLK